MLAPGRAGREGLQLKKKAFGTNLALTGSWRGQRAVGAGRSALTLFSAKRLSQIFIFFLIRFETRALIPRWGSGGCWVCCRAPRSSC